MTISEQIRALSEQGLSVSEIAQHLGIRYQHAYGVMKRQPAKPEAGRASDVLKKQPLLALDLLKGGFEQSSHWALTEEGELKPALPLPKVVGVYAFVKEGTAQYVGVATMGLAKRLRFYAKPGRTQKTSQRLNGVIKSELSAGSVIEIYTAAPPDLEWNGLPIHGSAGLELGLIKGHLLPWNLRSSG